VRKELIAFAAAIASIPLGAGVASADNGTPPADAAALVAAPAAPGAAPAIVKNPDGITVAISAGGQLQTGNTSLLAGTANATLDARKGMNGYGAYFIGNYGQGAPPGSQIIETAENYQGRLRYDRFVIDQASFFLIGTLRHDRFQGLDLRLNVDPGFKYLFLNEPTNKLWMEAGYDFQFDNRRSDALGVTAGSGAGGAQEPVPVDGCIPAEGLKQSALDGNIAPCAQKMLPPTQTDHSTRLFAGFRHAFNKEVNLSAGVEYLQSLLKDTNYDSRFNFDALVAAKVGGGLSIGMGFSARFDQNPLPGKEQLDTASTLTLIYSFSDIPEPPKPPTCPCPEPPPPPPPPPVAPPPPPPAAPAPGAAAPAPATAPATMAPAPATAPAPAPAPAPTAPNPPPGALLP